ncbi:hypothetical protein C8F01DRAFT_1380645 [Mycena amicta]|nr:hypothetical protein C8F01DRAFT_1380645 [Mycena amicta]
MYHRPFPFPGQPSQGVSWPLPPLPEDLPLQAVPSSPVFPVLRANESRQSPGPPYDDRAHSVFSDQPTLGGLSDLSRLSSQGSHSGQMATSQSSTSDFPGVGHGSQNALFASSDSKYIALLTLYQNLATEHSQLQLNHERLLASHKTMQSNFSDLTAAVSNKLSLITSVSSASSSASSPSISSQRPLVILNQTNYPNVPYWTRKQYKDAEALRSRKSGKLSMSAAQPLRGSSRAAQGENVVCWFITDAAGIAIGPARVGEIRALARAIFIHLDSIGMAPTTWTQSSIAVREYYVQELEDAFPELRFCDSHYKACEIAIITYSGWHTKFMKKKLGKNDPEEEEEKAMALVTAKRSSSTLDADDANSDDDAVSKPRPKKPKLKANDTAPPALIEMDDPEDLVISPDDGESRVPGPVAESSATNTTSLSIASARTASHTASRSLLANTPTANQPSIRVSLTATTSKPPPSVSAERPKPKHRQQGVKGLHLPVATPPASASTSGQAEAASSVLESAPNPPATAQFSGKRTLKFHDPLFASMGPVTAPTTRADFVDAKIVNAASKSKSKASASGGNEKGPPLARVQTKGPGATTARNFYLIDLQKERKARIPVAELDQLFGALSEADKRVWVSFNT